MNLTTAQLNESAVVQAPAEKESARPSVVIAGVMVEIFLDNNGWLLFEIDSRTLPVDPAVWTHDNGDVALAVKLNDTVICVH